MRESDVIDGFQGRRIAIVGTTKHAGKTTVLNALLRAYERVESATVGVASIGVDGERLDSILGIPKPEIWVDEGTVVATASECLEAADTSFEWVSELGIHSPLGDVVLARALAPGSICLAGVREVRHAALVCSKMEELGCSHVLLDGAFDRSAVAVPKLVDGVVLVVGATAGTTVQSVSEHATWYVHRLSLPKLADEWQECIAGARTCAEIAVVGQGSSLTYPRHLGLTDAAWRKWLAPTTELVYLPGAFTSGIADAFLSSGCEKVIIVTEAAVHIHVDAARLNALYRKGYELYVAESLPLLGIAVNPHHILGFDLSRSELVEAVQAIAPDVSVFSVEPGVHIR